MENPPSTDSSYAKITIKKEHLTPKHWNNNNQITWSSDRACSYAYAAASTTPTDSSDAYSNVALWSLPIQALLLAKKAWHSSFLLGCCTCSLLSKYLSTKWLCRHTGVDCAQFHSKHCSNQSKVRSGLLLVISTTTSLVKPHAGLEEPVEEVTSK